MYIYIYIQGGAKVYVKNVKARRGDSDFLQELVCDNATLNRHRELMNATYKSVSLVRFLIFHSDLEQQTSLHQSGAYQYSFHVFECTEK